MVEGWLALYSGCQCLMVGLDAYKLAQAWRAVGRSCGKKRKKESRFQSATPLTFLWWGGGPIRNIMSFLSLTQSALRCTADLPQCCTLHISGRWRDPAKEKRKKLLGIFYFFIWATEINSLSKEQHEKHFWNQSEHCGLICVTLLRTSGQG